jgi:peptidyl-prolyl cis-trans isomerase SurA
VKRLRFAVALALGLAAVGVAPKADAIIVERVVAVVGDRPILLSELRGRAKPNLLRLMAQKVDANFHAAAETEIYKEFLTRMIDERLEEVAADRAHLSVAPEDIDAAIERIAANAHVRPHDVVLEVRRQGLSEQDFRDELRRQILDGKLVELRVRPRVRVSDQDSRAAYQRYRQEIVDQHPVDLRILALRMTNDAAARTALANQIVEQARHGTDFCKLVELYTEDTETKGTCGSRGPQPMAALVPQMQEAIKDMKANQISDPMVVASPGAGEAIVIVQLLSEPQVPAFETVKNEMWQRAMMDGVERQRKLWLQELRRGVYIDVRL